MANAFTTEIWILYSLGTAILFLRFFTRWKVVGIRRIQADDAVAVLCLILFTLMISMMELAGHFSTNVVLTTDADRAALPQAIKDRISTTFKVANISLFAYIFLIYSLKAGLIFFFLRITLGQWQRMIVLWVAGISALFLIGSVLAFVLPCQPFSKRFQVYPNPGPKCSGATEAQWVITIGDVLTDLIFIFMVFTLMWNMKLSLGKKLATGAMLASGGIVTIAAILRLYFTLNSTMHHLEPVLWAVRESFVAIFAVNIAPIGPFFTPSKWNKSSRFRQWSSSNYAFKRNTGVGSGRLSSSIRGEIDAIELATAENEEGIIQSS